MVTGRELCSGGGEAPGGPPDLLGATVAHREQGGPCDGLLLGVGEAPLPPHGRVCPAGPSSRSIKEEPLKEPSVLGEAADPRSGPGYRVVSEGRKLLLEQWGQARGTSCLQSFSG